MTKRISLFRLLVISLLSACAFHHQEDWMNDIEGTYVIQYQQPYSIGWDTLIIQRSGKVNSIHFTLQRHTRYERLINGQKKVPVSKLTTSQVEADKSATALIQTSSGRRYYFNPVKKEITTGNVTYYKLN
jgi:hypothetical protein